MMFQRERTNDLGDYTHATIWGIIMVFIPLFTLFHYLGFMDEVESKKEAASYEYKP